jgi:serine/threonine-protein kinase
MLGTAGYMSPEQVRGQEADKRADIWAFGCVLYEMLAGKRAFSGPTVSDTLASILKGEPDLSGIPAKVRRLLESCLEKDPRRRLRDIGDAWRLLGVGQEVESTALSQSRLGTGRRLGSTGWIVAGVLAAVLALAALTPAWWRTSPPTPVWTGILLGGPEVTLSPRPSPCWRSFHPATTVRRRWV